MMFVPILRHTSIQTKIKAMLLTSVKLLVFLQVELTAAKHHISGPPMKSHV